MAALKKAGKGAFIPFLVAGDPDLDTTAEAILELDRAGADIIELGVPYSDPLADGPIIQAAATRALASGTTLDKVLAMVERMSPRISARLVMFTYYNPIMRRGAERFCQQAKAAGASGLLVPDIPLEETTDIRRFATAAGLELVVLVTPTTPEERMREIVAVSQGFVYLVSVAGVTGQRPRNESRVEGLIKLLHGMTDKPIAVGFAVSGPEQARQLMAWGAEGVIVGSALVEALAAAPSPAEGVRAVGKLARSIRAAV
ncbi:hypothetical protein WJX81_006056 [Elliptochloris bilobata]|uniref:tryptophan synthase n=1 Tax=Elliptochloris bilobata TaxID=381761 RepID=A0AAW1SLU4_9CHLO